MSKKNALKRQQIARLCQPTPSHFRYEFLDQYRKHKPSNFILFDDVIDLIACNLFPNEYAEVNEDFKECRNVALTSFDFANPDPTATFRTVPVSTSALGFDGPKFTLATLSERSYPLPDTRVLLLRRQAWDRYVTWLRQGILTIQMLRIDGTIVACKKTDAQNRLRRQARLVEGTGCIWKSGSTNSAQLELVLTNRAQLKYAIGAELNKRGDGSSLRNVSDSYLSSLLLDMGDFADRYFGPICMETAGTVAKQFMPPTKKMRRIDTESFEKFFEQVKADSPPHAFCATGEKCSVGPGNGKKLKEFSIGFRQYLDAEWSDAENFDALFMLGGTLKGGDTSTSTPSD